MFNTLLKMSLNPNIIKHMIKIKNNKKKRRYFKETSTKLKNEKNSLNGKLNDDKRLSIFQ